MVFDRYTPDDPEYVALVVGAGRIWAVRPFELENFRTASSVADALESVESGVVIQDRTPDRRRWSDKIPDPIITVKRRRTKKKTEVAPHPIVRPRRMNLDE